MEETRRALIVANSDYPGSGFSGLTAPVRDAEELARVLRDPSIGGFEVATVLNEKAGMVSKAIEEFFVFNEPKQDDLLLLYFSGHGVTDDDGHLYLATADTEMVRQNVRRSSAVAAEFIDGTMRRSRSRRQVLLLDCCHSGAFAEGMRVKGEPLPALDSHFRAIQGKGRVVLTASTGTEFSFEGSREKGEQLSVFTRLLVKGLETGEADRQGDGQVDLDELHEYLLEQLRTEAPGQTPTKSGYLEGQIFIARSKVLRAVELPMALRNALSASEPWMRLGAITELEELLRGGHVGLALAARQSLAQLRDSDDSLRVRKVAAKCLAEEKPEAGESGDARARAEQERVAREEAERRAQAEQERAAREEADRRTRAEQEHAAREEAERRARAERERVAREEAERRARAEQDRKAREAAERRRVTGLGQLWTIWRRNLGLETAAVGSEPASVSDSPLARLPRWRRELLLFWPLTPTCWILRVLACAFLAITAATTPAVGNPPPGPWLSLLICWRVELWLDLRADRKRHRSPSS